MEVWLPFLLAFLSAFLVTCSRIYTSDKFHNYFFLITRDGIFFIYCFIYGILGVVLLLILKKNTIKITGDITDFGNYLYPLAVGTITKGVSDINFFNIKTDGFAFPVGLKTITQPIDKFFEEKLDGVSFRKSKAYLEPYLVKYRQVLANDFSSNIANFRADISSKLKRYHPDEKKTKAFEKSQDFIKTASSDEILVLVLREFGRTVFESIFSLA